MTEPDLAGLTRVIDEYYPGELQPSESYVDAAARLLVSARRAADAVDEVMREAVEQ